MVDNSFIEIDVIDSESDSDDNFDFFFESAHLALRGNEDYLKVLKTLSLLNCVQIQATKDYEKLLKIQKEALQDPEEFVKKLSNKESNIDFPKPLKIPEIPSDLIRKYDINEIKVNLERNDMKFSEYNLDKCEDEYKNENNIHTLGKAWTSEEQRRLEELLIQYPPEQFEMRRFAKISRALGNRTTKQVASRVQKFFLKLHSAGLPIPGRIPKSQRYTQSKAHRYNKHTFKPSTFFPAHDVPVNMPDDSELFCDSFSTLKTDNFGLIDEKYSNNFIKMEPTIESDNEFNKNLTNDEITLKLLQNVQEEKELDKLSNNILVTHFNCKCNSCKDEPIIGTRWHCFTCKDKSVDFCSDCLISLLTSDNPHPLNHNIKKFSVKKENNSSSIENSSDDES